MYINYKKNGDAYYAMVVKSVRNGNTVSKEETIYLGRVIDKEKHIYKNRERGLYIYNLETNSYDKVPADYIEPEIQHKTKYPTRQALILSFGDVFFMNEFIKLTKFRDAINAIGFKNSDTLYALFFYYTLSPHANCHAKDWYDLSYVKFLYPKAQMSSQRISEALVDIGSEEAKRNFFSKYLDLLREYNSDNINKKGIDGGILIDSSGLPNQIHFPLTAVSNHNGIINEEVRLIYVVDQKSGMPLFFRYISGNIIDVSTITRTISELKSNGVNIQFAILDAGYYTGKNADILIDSKISFITRLKMNLKLYKKIVKDNLSELEVKENLVIYNKRMIYVKCIPCKIGENEDKDGYAYLCKDLTMRSELEKHIVEKAMDQNISGEEIFDKLIEQGIFILISSQKIENEELLPLYYTRDQVEKIFEICKQDAKILPLNVENEKTFRGHLMMTFMAVATFKMLSDKLVNTSLTAESIFMNLHEQHVLVYDDQFITTEPNKKMNDAYKLFGIDCPITIPR